jgi:hypothetical protein
LIAAQENRKKERDYDDYEPLGKINEARKVQEKSTEIQNGKKGNEDNGHIHDLDLASKFSDYRWIAAMRHSLILQLDQHDTYGGCVAF